MKLKSLVLLVLIAALIVSLGCAKEEEVDTGTPGAPVTKAAKPADAPADTAADADLPAIGEELDLSMTMMGETEDISIKIVELDQAMLDEIGLPAYPGAVACEATSEEMEDEGVVVLLTKDDVAKVTDYYTTEVPGLTDAKDQMIAMTEEMMKGMAEFSTEEDLAKMDADLKEMREADLAMLTTEDEKGGVIINASDQGYTVIVLTAEAITGGMDEGAGMEPGMEPGMDMDTDIDLAPADDAAATDEAPAADKATDDKAAE